MAKANEPTDSSREQCHAVDLKYVRPGDVLRVRGASKSLDPAVVASHWPFFQRDFSAERHREDSHVKRWTRTDATVEPPETREVEKVTRLGNRLTVLTRDRTEYAVVDWKKTEDAPLIYLKVIDSDDPDGVRWRRVDELETLERYGPERDREQYCTGPPGHTPKPWETTHTADDGDFDV